MRFLRLGLLAMSIYLMAACPLAGCGRPEKAAPPEAGEKEPSLIKVTVVKVEPTLVRDVLILPGALKPWQEIRVSAGIGGRVEWIGPQEGQSIKKGELLAKINVSALKASLDSAQSAFDLADKTWQRLTRLYENKIISRESLDQAETQRTAAEGALRQIKDQYQEGFVHAPVSGYIENVYIEAGEFTGAGAPMFDLVDVSRMKVDVNVPELDVRYLKIGQKCLVSVDAFKEKPPVQGVIIFVSRQASQVTKTFRTTISVDNNRQDLRAGMVARAAFLKKEVPEALAVPLSAVVNKGGERIIFVEENGLARARKVEFGIIERDRVQIISGLNIGENLVVEGQSNLEEGVKVQVR